MHGHGPYSWAAFLACLLLMDLPMLRADPALLPLLYLGVTAQVEGKASPKALVLVKKKKVFSGGKSFRGRPDPAAHQEIFRGDESLGFQMQEGLWCWCAR